MAISSTKIFGNSIFQVKCSGIGGNNNYRADFVPLNYGIKKFNIKKLEIKCSGRGGGRNSGGGGVGGGGGGGGWDGEDGEKFGPLMKFEEVMWEAEVSGASLPTDMIEAAKSVGIRRLFFERYLDLQESGWLLGFLMRHCSMLRDRMLADPSFLFRLRKLIVINSFAVTFAEVKKRGKDFWSEFELYAADLLVVTLIYIAAECVFSPYARIGKQSVRGGTFGRLQHACASLPRRVFEGERPGCKFSLQQWVAKFFYTGVFTGSVGFGCGLIGQGIANLIMTVKRSIKKSEGDIPVPALVKSAALWGVFLAVSTNIRYQITSGLEFIVESSPIAKRVPLVELAFKVGIRFANKIYAIMQFVDWAKLSGVQ